MLLPEPTVGPLGQVVENHCHVAPVPSSPPVKVNVVELPGQMLGGLATRSLLDGATEFVLTSTYSSSGGPAPQLFSGVTVMSPELLPAVTIMLELLCPDVMVKPGGKLQL